MNKLKTVPGVIEASKVNDIITKITSDNVRNLKDTIHNNRYNQVNYDN